MSVHDTCHFCGTKFTPEPGTKPEDGLFKEEVGEFWSIIKQDSVLAHPDCLPLGIDAVFNETDPEWRMA